MDYSGRTRRTMGEALMSERLSPDELAFVTGNSGPTTTIAEFPSRKKSSPRKPAPNSETQTGLPAPTVSMTFRLPADLPRLLLKISAERKVRRLVPFTQQDIVAEALRKWIGAQRAETKTEEPNLIE